MADARTAAWRKWPGVNVIKLFTVVIYEWARYARVVSPWQAFLTHSNVYKQDRSLPERVLGSWPYPQTLDYARKSCQGQTLAYSDRS